MSKTIIAPVTPEMMVWARKRCNLEVIYVSRKLKVTVETVQQWESGDAKPSLAKLREVSALYKIPLEAFFLPKPPDKYHPPFTVMNLKDFRRLPDSAESKFSPQLSLEIREAVDRRTVILDLREQLEEDMPEFRLAAYQNETPQDLAKRIRDIMSVGNAEQMEWRDSRTALKRWISAIEDIGVLVFQTGMFMRENSGVTVEEMRGIAISMPNLPIILINGQDAEVARIFTLMHELCHLLRRVSGINNDLENTWSSASADDTLEIYCNQFSAELLVPVQALMSDYAVKNHDKRTAWDDSEIIEIAVRFHVSREMILRRLVTLNLATQAFYQRKRTSYVPQEKAKRKFVVPYDSKLVKWHGESYISTVLRAYHNDLIDERDVGDYLNAKTRWIESLERRVPS